jgi:hypothetical protein
MRFTWRSTLPLFVAVVLALGVILARFSLLTKQGAIWIQSHAGYYLVLAAVSWMVYCIVRVLRRKGGPDWREVFRRHWRQASVVLAAAAFLHVHEPHMFKVLFDEPSHVAGSLMMHEERMAVAPGSAHRFYGGLVYKDNYPSFRLYSFQVVLSVVHDLTGYRPENVFVLNGAITLVVMSLLYLAGHRIAGQRGGLLAVLLLAGLPLLAQNATSGGYDVLNLALLLGLFLATGRHLRDPTKENLDLMVSVGVVLALTRYESIAYLIVPVVAAAIGWVRQRRITLSWAAAISPLLTLPSFAANVILLTTDTFLLAQIREEGQEFFDTANIFPHVQDLVVYLFSVDNDGTNSVLLSVMGAASLFGLLVAVATRLPKRSTTISIEGGLLAGLALLTLGLYALTLANFWGSPLDILAARFTLPLQAVFALSTCWAFADFRRSRAVPRGALWVSVAYVILAAVPANSKHTSTDMMVAGRSMQWFVEYAKKHDAGRTLYAAQSNMPMVINKLPAVSIKSLNQRRIQAAQCLQAGIYDEIVVHQFLWVDPVSGRLHPGVGDSIDEGFVYEVLEQEKFLPDAVSRIVRLTGVRGESGEVIALSEVTPPRTEFASGDEQVSYLYGLLP